MARRWGQGSDAATGWTGLQDIYPCSANYVPSMSDQFEGSCLCGAVRFVATGQPKGISGLVTKTG
jgi:hypothetical protein